MPSITIGAGVGDVVPSVLTESQFQAERGAEWVLMDGRSIVGSRLNAITGATNLYDARSMILKGKMNDRADAFADPDGETAIGTQQADRNKYHDHDYADPGHTHNVHNDANVTGGGALIVHAEPRSGSTSFSAYNSTNTTGITHNADGSVGEDARPNCLILNFFCKIN